MNTFIKRVSVFLLIIGSTIDSSSGEDLEKGHNKTSLQTTKLGVRTFQIGTKSYKIPWYRVRYDYNAIKTESFWKRLVSIQGAKAAYIGSYQKIQWCVHTDQMSSLIESWGISFLVKDIYRVEPGPGKVNIRWWLYEEKHKNNEMVFRDGRYYVFYLNRQPVEQWRNLANEPSCDIDTELSHIIGIAAIEPTFEFNENSVNKVLYVTSSTLLEYREERHDINSVYNKEYAMTRAKNGDFQLYFSGTEPVPAPSETIQKLLYSINTCSWKKEEGSYKFEINPPVTKTFVKYSEKDDKTRELIINYDNGNWYIIDSDQSYYRTAYPHLLFEVKKEIRDACESEGRHP